MRTRELNQLLNAINDRKLATIELNGDRLARRVEPYCVFKSTTGKVLLDCYQLSGDSQSNKPIGWRTLNLAKIRSVSSKPIVRFNLRDAFKPNSDRYSNRLLMVERSK